MTEQQKSLIEKFRSDGLGYAAIAKTLFLSKDSVKAYCRNHSLGGVRSEMVRVKNVELNYCPVCGKTLSHVPGKKHKKFCSDECRLSWWHKHPENGKKKAFYTFTCPECGKEFQSYGNSKRKYCSHKCYITSRYYTDNLLPHQALIVDYSATKRE